MNLGGCKRRNGGTIAYDKNGVPWIASVPIKFKLAQIWAADDTGARVSFSSIGASDIENMLREFPELSDRNPDKEKIMNLLEIIQKRTIRAGPGVHHNRSFKAGSERSMGTSGKYYPLTLPHPPMEFG